LIDGWRSSLADADLADWLTVAAYLLAALLAWQAAGKAWLSRQGRDRVFWTITTVLLCFLGVNELLDLQTLLTDLGRAHARAYGWYDQHRQVQYVFVIALGVFAITAGLGMLWLTRRTPSAVRLALVGLVFIGVFVFLRAASFHHLDDLLGRDALVFNWGTLQELAGIAIVALAAQRYGRSKPVRRSRR
jgi:hypothetical protein